MPTTASSTIHPPPICPGRLLTHEGPFPLLDPAMTPDILESNIPSNMTETDYGTEWYGHGASGGVPESPPALPPDRCVYSRDHAAHAAGLVGD